MRVEIDIPDHVIEALNAANEDDRDSIMYDYLISEEAFGDCDTTLDIVQQIGEKLDW